jgi:N-acetylglucosamine kinase-like BadF-type ATPase
MKLLEFYLGIIEEQRHWDAVNDPDGLDKGSAYYIGENCIKSIRRALVCRGFSAGLLSKIFDIFGLYDLTDTTPREEKEGIGVMGLEAETGKVFNIS